MNLSRRLLGTLLAAWASAGILAAQAQVTNANANTATTSSTVTNALPPLPLPLPAPAAFEAGEAAEAARLPMSALLPLEPLPPLPTTSVRMGGLIGDAVAMDQPLQLLNPLAPASYGDGTRNLSVHPTTGRVEGVTLFSLRLFKTKPEGKQRRPAKPVPDSLR
ncbi:MAG: hypothetical protein HS113_26145 [Verrucomicrobiales bacterium]|nr:hypothetical protein [Verrucomicrobiales bacterium]